MPSPSEQSRVSASVVSSSTSAPHATARPTTSRVRDMLPFLTFAALAVAFVLLAAPTHA